MAKRRFFDISGAIKQKEAQDPVTKLYQPQELVVLSERMQGGIEVKNRRDKWRWHSDCFRGSQAVDWLLENTAVESREAATDLGAELLGRGLIFHVRHRHGFQDRSKRLYRFQAQDDSMNSSESDAASITSGTSNSAKRLIDNYDSLWTRRISGSYHTIGRGRRATKWSKGQELTNLQGKVLELDIALEDQKEMQGILVDAISDQIRGLQTITHLLTEKLKKANSGVQRLELALVVAVCLQLVGFAWLSGPSTSVLMILVLSLTLGYIWHRHRFLVAEDTAASYQQAEEVADQSKGGLRGTQAWGSVQEWIESHASKDLSTARGIKQAAARDIPSGISSDGSSDSSISEAAQAKTFNPLPSLTIRRITEETPSDGAPSRQSSVRNTSKQAGEGAADDAKPLSTGPPSTSDFKDWVDAPVMVKPKPLTYQQCKNLTRGCLRVNTGRPVEFETDSFKGCAVIWVQGLKSAPPDLFAGLHRKTSVTVQGRFKDPAGFEDIVTGQEFSRPAVNLPAKWLVESVLVKIARSISPSMDIGPLCKPYLLVPAAAACQAINVSMPGEEPDPSRTVPENMTLYDKSLVDRQGCPLSGEKRKRYFWNPKMRKQREYTTEHVWTFVMYQSQVNMSTYGLDVALRYDLTRHLDGQPLQFMMKDRAKDTYLFSFEAWHEKLLENTAETSS